MMVKHRGDRSRIRHEHTLEVLRLDVLRSEVVGVAGFLVHGPQVEELANTLATTDSLFPVTLFERIDSIDQVLMAFLQRLELRHFLL